MEPELTSKNKRKMEVRYRRGNDKDINFILHSWMTSFRMSPFAKHMDPDTYYQFQELKIKELLSRNPNILIACNPEHDYQIYGYVVYEFDPDILHYVYVKSIYRKTGIAGDLIKILDLPAKTYNFTHYTTHFQPIHTKYKDSLIYNPYLLT